MHNLSSSPGRRPARYTAGVAVAILGGGIALSACQPASTGQDSAVDLLVSASPTRSAPIPLDGSRLAGPVAIFVDAPADTTSVAFYLDDRSMTKRPRYVDRSAPWDLASNRADGNARTVDPRRLPAGKHWISVRRTALDGTISTGSASFTVGAGSSFPTGAPTTEPTTGTSPAPTPTAPTTAPTPVTTPSAPTSPGPSAPAGVTLRPVDGGAGYYGKWKNGLPADPSFFPVGVWLEGVHAQSDVDMDKAAGINTYVGLTADSDLQLVAKNGMKVLGQDEWWSRSTAAGSQAFAGWTLSDEVDMTDGPGKGFATQAAINGRLPKDTSRMRYTNYGKGVTFWESDSDAARFVNDYQDVVSADNYWFTDPGICGVSEGGALLNHDTQLPAASCRKASNYGATVDRLRALAKDSKPVWNFVEVGHPFTENSAPSITPAQVTAATWSSLIHGARGIVYFNHSFGGPNQTQHALREPAYASVRAAVVRTGAQIKALAPVLNAPTVGGLFTTAGQVDTMVKASGGALYVFAGSNGTAAQTATFSAPCAGSGTVTVVNENRTLVMTSGTFSDAFADGNAVHIYRIGNAAACGLG